MKKLYSVKTTFKLVSKSTRVWAVCHEQAAVIALQDWKLEESQVGDITVSPLSQ